MSKPYIFLTLLAGGTAVAGNVQRPAISGVSHIAVYAATPSASERFYVHDLGAIKGPDPERPAGVRYYFSTSQFVEVLPLPPGQMPVNRLDHVAFATADAEELRAYLGAHGIKVPASVKRGTDNSRWFDTTDPEGNHIQFVQDATRLPMDTNIGLSGRIIHVGYIIHSPERENAFFRAILGFRPYWYGGMQDDIPTWISLQVPDGSDWLEYMVAGAPEQRGIPADMKPSDVGVLNHFALGVNNMEIAYTLLWNGDRLSGQDALPKIGRDAKWQLNLLDPDGTRAEIMEFHAIGTPCCSSFSGQDPK